MLAELAVALVVLLVGMERLMGELLRRCGRHLHGIEACWFEIW